MTDPDCQLLARVVAVEVKIEAQKEAVHTALAGLNRSSDNRSAVWAWVFAAIGIVVSVVSLAISLKE